MGQEKPKKLKEEKNFELIERNSGSKIPLTSLPETTEAVSKQDPQARCSDYNPSFALVLPALHDFSSERAVEMRAAQRRVDRSDEMPCFNRI